MGLRNQCSQPPRKDYGYGGCSWRPSQVLMVSLLPLQEHILPQARAYYRVDQAAEPDVWLDAVQVWEVKCADLSLSPVYKAAMGLVSSAAPPTSARTFSLQLASSSWSREGHQRPCMLPGVRRLTNPHPGCFGLVWFHIYPALVPGLVPAWFQIWFQLGSSCGFSLVSGRKLPLS